MVLFVPVCNSLLHPFSGTVSHSEEHHEGFEETAIGMKGCLPFVSGLDTYIIETPSNVKLCEVLGSAVMGIKGNFDHKIKVTTNRNRIISKMFHSCALNK